MTQDQLTSLFSKLVEKEAELLPTIKDRSQIAIESVSDILDFVSGANDREVFLTSLTKTIATLTMVQAALHRITEGTYGECLHCEEAIGLKRLNAVPWAKFCIICQEMIEKEQTPEVEQAV